MLHEDGVRALLACFCGATWLCALVYIIAIGTRSSLLPSSILSQVSELEQQLVLNSPAPLQLELEGCQARLKQAQASLGAREATIRELRHRLEEHVKWVGGVGVEEKERGENGMTQLARFTGLPAVGVDTCSPGHKANGRKCTI